MRRRARARPSSRFGHRRDQCVRRAPSIAPVGTRRLPYDAMITGSFRAPRSLSRTHRRGGLGLERQTRCDEAIGHRNLPPPPHTETSRRREAKDAARCVEYAADLIPAPCEFCAPNICMDILILHRTKQITVFLDNGIPNKTSNEKKCVSLRLNDMG